MFRNFIKIVVLGVCTVFAYIVSCKKEPAILMYHSFSQKDWKHNVSSKALMKQLLYLLRKRTVVPLSDIVLYAQGDKEIPRNAVAITIDDGYEDTYTKLFPFAQKYSIPFTVFLTTDLSSMEKLGNLPRPKWDQLKEMAASELVDIGVHGHSHVNFPEVLQKGAEHIEIDTSRQLIEERLNVKADMISYPAGRYNKNVISYVRAQGYTAGITTRMGIVQPGDDTLLLRRIVVDKNTPYVLFRQRLHPGFTLYLRTLQWIRKKYV